MKRIEDTNRKGDMAEYYAVTWLWDNGYEVFKNCGCTGIVDLIAMKDGEITLIDVKTLKPKRNQGGVGPRSKKQKEQNVRFLGFNADTRKLRFVEHRA